MLIIISGPIDCPEI